MIGLSEVTFELRYVSVKGAIMQIEKALINDRFCVSKIF